MGWAQMRAEVGFSILMQTHERKKKPQRGTAILPADTLEDTGSERTKGTAHAYD